MMKHRVGGTGDALAYIADCTLATVCDMAMKRRRPKHEFDRQISIAQTAIDWMLLFGVDLSSTRAEDVVSAGGVKEWAAKYMPEPNATKTPQP